MVPVGSLSESLQRIQRHIQLQNRDDGFPENAERSVPDVVDDKGADPILVKAPGLRDPGYLVKGGSRADVRIEAAARGGHEIHRDRQAIVRISFAQSGDT